MEAVGDNPRSSSEAVAHKTRRGFSLIEAAFVLAVVGAVIGTIWVAAATVIENHKVNKTVEGVFSTARNIQNLISIRDGESIGNMVLITDKLIDAGVFPEDWIYGTAVKNPLGANVLVRNWTGVTRFDLRFDGIKASDCVKLITKISAIGANAGSSGSGLSNRQMLGYIGIYDSTASVLFTTSTFPVTLEQATIKCVSSYIVIFTFGYSRIN